MIDDFLPCVCSYSTFASAGSDGTVSIWDHKSKKRLRQYPKYNSPVPSIAFNCDGSKLAVGVSYTWEEGEEGAKTAERPAVFIKNVGEEVKVRQRALCRSFERLTADRLPAQRLDGAKLSAFRQSYPGAESCDACCIHDMLQVQRVSM